MFDQLTRKGTAQLMAGDVDVRLGRVMAQPLLKPVDGQPFATRIGVRGVSGPPGNRSNQRCNTA